MGKEKAKKTLKIMGNVIIYALLACLILILIFTVISRFMGNSPKLFGYQVQVIATGSMEPELMVGDVILSKVYDGQTLEVGDVITFIGKEGSLNGKLVTHKIISIDSQAQKIVTQGVANDTADAPISFEQVQSVLVRNTVVLKFMFNLVKQPITFVLLVILPLVIMIGYESYSIVKQIKTNKEDANESKK